MNRIKLYLRELHDFWVWSLHLGYLSPGGHCEQWVQGAGSVLGGGLIFSGGTTVSGDLWFWGLGPGSCIWVAWAHGAYRAVGRFCVLGGNEGKRDLIFFRCRGMSPVGSWCLGVFHGFGVGGVGTALGGLLPGGVGAWRAVSPGWWLIFSGGATINYWF